MSQLIPSDNTAYKLRMPNGSCYYVALINPTTWMIQWYSHDWIDSGHMTVKFEFWRKHKNNEQEKQS